MEKLEPTMKVTYQENFPLSLINENDREFQPRLDYDEAALEALSKDIAKNGQHNPVGLYQKGDYFQVVYGFQRVIALKRGDGEKGAPPRSYSGMA